VTAIDERVTSESTRSSRHSSACRKSTIRPRARVNFSLTKFEDPFHITGCDGTGVGPAVARRSRRRNARRLFLARLTSRRVRAGAPRRQAPAKSVNSAALTADSLIRPTDSAGVRLSACGTPACAPRCSRVAAHRPVWWGRRTPCAEQTAHVRRSRNRSTSAAALPRPTFSGNTATDALN
jgi:hypothetical protein